MSADNLKSLWCIYLGSGLWRGWQILHDEFARCLLAASSFQAPWRERRTKPTAWVPRGRVGGALVWLLTCKCLRGPRRSFQTLEPSFQPHKAQPWMAAGCALWGTRHPGCRGKSQISSAVKLLCGTVTVDWKFPQVHAVRVVSLDVGRQRLNEGFWNKKEYY